MRRYYAFGLRSFDKSFTRKFLSRSINQSSTGKYDYFHLSLVPLGSLTICMLGNFSYFVVCCLISILTVSKHAFRNTIRVSNSLIQIRTNVLLVLIWVQTICKGYQQTTKSIACKEIFKLLNKLMELSVMKFS